MARIRTIKPEFCTSEDTGALSRDARLFFLQLLTEADDEGRLQWIPKRIAGVLYPHDDDVGAAELDAWASECESRGMVRRYSVDGARYLQVTNWDKHQKISHPSKSRLPSIDLAGIPGDSGNPPEKFRKDSGESQETLRPDLGTGNREQGTGRRADKPPRPATAARTYLGWLEALPEDEPPLPADDPVFAYAAKVGIPEDFVALAWAWFENTYGPDGSRRAKRYADWRAVFRNAVEGNWAKAWYSDGDGYRLTTVGLQLQRSQREAA